MFAVTSQIALLNDFPLMIRKKVVFASNYSNGFFTSKLAMTYLLASLLRSANSAAEKERGSAQNLMKAVSSSTVSITGTTYFSITKYMPLRRNL